MKLDEGVDRLYKKRFEGEFRKRNEIWQVLCASFFQKYVDEDDRVLDIGAGSCEFINNIRCRSKCAVDLNKETAQFAKEDVKVFQCRSTDLSPLTDSSFDVIFMSNFLEHMETKADILKTLSECFRILSPGGKVLVLGPNIRYAYREYWDFFDHYIPLSDKSLVEALHLTGFAVESVFPRFLPYTTKSKLPSYAFLIRSYLKMPLIWKVLGKQLFIAAKK